ncbi:MAG: BON domain-containing protein [bacterium]
MQETKKQLLFFFTFTLFIFSISFPVVSEFAKNSNEEKAQQIRLKLLVNDDIEEDQINVLVKDKIAKLTGSVNNLWAKEKAENITLSIRGIMGVVNNLNLTFIERPDAAIIRNVNMALAKDPALESHEITVTAEDGVIKLKGVVDSWQEKEFAAMKAKSIPGVIGLENYLSINFEDPRSDEEIKEDILKVIANDIWLEEEFINVTVNDAKVKLQGQVPTVYERERLLNKAWVTGVQQVSISDLDINPNLKTNIHKKAEFIQKSDKEILNAIINSFKIDPEVSNYQITALVNDGVVTLSGEIANLDAKQKAQTNANNVVGVKMVSNLIEVEPVEKIRDNVLADRAKEILQQDPLITTDNMEVKVDKRKLKLLGFVKEVTAKRRAEKALRPMRGIASIENNLEVKTPIDLKTDQALEKQILSNFASHPTLDWMNLRINVDEGIVTLKGKVPTWYEKRIAELEALRAGAMEVDNDLEIINE